MIGEHAKVSALEEAGFTPAPWVGQRWEDRGVTWLPDGHRSEVTIVGLGPTVSGWQAHITRMQVDRHGCQAGERFAGTMYVQQLFDNCVPRPSQHLLRIEVDSAGQRLFRLECSGVGDGCRLYRPDICPDECKPVPEMAGEDNWWDEDELVVAHGVVHRYFDGEWMAGTDTCFYATHPNLADTASELFDDTGQPLGPGRYRVALFMEQGEFLQIGLEEK